MDIQICYFVTFLFPVSAVYEVLHDARGSRNNVFFISACAPFCCRYDGLIVSLASAGSEINLIRLCSDTGCDLLSCFLQYFLGLLSRSMKTWCVCIYVFPDIGIIASNATWLIFVVAALSKYTFIVPHTFCFSILYLNYCFLNSWISYHSIPLMSIGIEVFHSRMLSAFLTKINMARNEALAVLHSVLNFCHVIDIPGYDRIH